MGGEVNLVKPVGNDIDLLVQGGVTPLETVGGVVSPVRGITTRTLTGGARAKKSIPSLMASSVA